jgi:ribosome-associated protein
MIEALEEKKGENIVLLEVQALTTITEYFVICTATSNRMLSALADGITQKTKGMHKKKAKFEGQTNTGWISIDYGSIIVHLFDQDLRNYYNLEELWGQGKLLLRIQ